jgi:hypothetical protein
MESVIEVVRSWVFIFLVRGMFGLNPDAIEQCKHNLATVPYLEFYYLTNQHDSRFNWEQISNYQIG